MARRILLSTALMLTAGSCTQHEPHSRELVTASAKTITVWPDTITLWRGDTLRLRAIAIAATDSVLDGTNVVWSTSDSSIVTVAEGLATAQRSGSATIVASSGGHSGSARVNVRSGERSGRHVLSNKGREAK